MCFFSVTPALQTSPFPSPSPVSQHRHVSGFVPIAFLCSFCCAVSLGDCHFLNPRKMPKAGAVGPRRYKAAAPSCPQEDQGSFVGLAHPYPAQGRQWWGYGCRWHCNIAVPAPSPAGAPAQAVSLPCSIFPYSAVPSVTDIQDHH